MEIIKYRINIGDKDSLKEKTFITMCAFERSEKGMKFNMNNLKNMLVLKDLPSNLIEEAYIVLNPNLKLKMKETKEAEDNAKDNKVLSKDYILEEAKYVLLNYISKFETKSEKVNIKLLEKKYKKLKKITIFTLVAFLIYVIITAII